MTPRLSAAAFLLLTLATPAGLWAQSLPPAEKQKIEMLIRNVEEMAGAEFVRNGRAYEAATAATFLRRKWRANDSQVRSAQEFIDKVASRSETSGKPYLIRFQDGKETSSRDFLLTKLKTIEVSASDNRHSGGS